MTNIPHFIGPYHIIELLGLGGMGVVYRGQHHQSGQQVAVKTVRITNQGLLQSIRREIRALARLSHPGIVRIVDEGIHHGLPWYAMELLAGKTLRHYARDALNHFCLQPRDKDDDTAELAADPSVKVRPETRPWWTHSLTGSAHTEFEPAANPKPGEEVSEHHYPLSHSSPLDQEYLSTILTLLCRLCAPLAYLHGEGMVHRDLKPDNIFVTPDNYPVLVDFGLIAEFDREISRESLSVDIGGEGTVNYMAPEQILGETVDSRADLYAFGCILYELLTNQPPFTGTTTLQIINAHLSQQALLPSRIIPGLATAFDELMLSLLAKDPYKRLGYASDVAHRLIKLGARQDYPHWGPSPRSYLFPPVFAGRNELQTFWRQYLNRLRQQAKGALLALGGESGVGKTRLATEFAKEATRQGMLVLIGECGASSSFLLEAFRKPFQTITDRCRAGGVEETDRILGARGKILALYEPAFLGLPGQEAYPEPDVLPGPLAKQRLFHALFETLKALGARHPLILIIDDVHWADDLVLGFLEFVLHAEFCEHHPLLILTTFRTEEVGNGLEILLKTSPLTLWQLNRLD
ncbi:serine/threonine protein kinase, partial [candidate division CSSED10-310 bacterium]